LNHLTSNDLTAAGLGHLVLASGTDNRTRARAPLGVVTHTPSVTFARKALEAYRKDNRRDPTPLELDIVASRRFDVAKYQPNFLIGLTGHVGVLDWDDQRTLHSGGLALECPAGDVYAANRWREWASPSDGSGWRKHGRDPLAVYDWWDAAFPAAKSPLDVFPWGHYPNEAVGVDLLPDPVTGQYTDEQRAAWVKLVRLLAKLHGFPIDARHVTTHSYASPCERGTVVRGGKIIGVHWDPDGNIWDHAAMLAEARK